LNCNPEIAQELYAQLTEMTQREPDYGLASLEQATLVDHVLRESLRMIPPVAIFGRRVRNDRKTTLGDRELPPNTPVLICAATVQRSAGHWNDPDTFDPGRWANGGVESNPIGSDYFFPFGRGPRICPGADLAMFCMKIVLAAMLSQATVKTSGPFKGVLHCGVVETPELKARLIPHPVAASAQ
jgi:cytochrome P450